MPSKKPVIVCAADLEYAPKARQALESAFQVKYIEPTPDKLENAIKDAHAYYASLFVRLTEEIMKKAPNLKAVTTPSTGLDHIDLEYASKNNIAVLCLKNDREFLDKITATAELAWTLILAASRHLPAAVNAAKQGNWARDAFRGHQIAYKTLGILGCGRLGNMVAQYGRAFRMNVIGYDTADVKIDGVTQVSYEQLLEQSDILSIHIHLNEQNRRFVDKKAIADMKKGAVLINTSRGAIVDENALITALHSGHLSAAATDVIEGEWQENLLEHPMIKYSREHDNLIITPHIGGVTYESQEMAFLQAALKLKDYFKNHEFEV